MRKVCVLCICLFLCLGMLTGCSQTAAEGHIETADGISLTLGEDGGNLKEKLGEPAAYAEAQSCYGTGMDKVYTYEGFEVTTYPSKDGTSESVCVLALTDPTGRTAEGLQVGMNFTKAVDLYGEVYGERGTSRVYTLESDITLWVDVDEEMITRIEFRAP